MTTSDHLLLDQWIQKRDAEAFKALATKYCPMVHGTCLRILRNTTDAEDVTQECLVALARSPRTPQGALGAWLHRIATYQALNFRRANRRRGAREECFAMNQASLTETHWDDITPFIDAAIAELPEHLRDTIVLHFMEDESVTAIAARENVTPSAISQRIQKGVRLIRQHLRRRGLVLTGAVLNAMLSQQTFAVAPETAHLSRVLARIALSGGTTRSAVPLAYKGLAGIAAAVLLVLVAVSSTVFSSSQIATAASPDAPPPAVESAREALPVAPAAEEKPAEVTAPETPVSAEAVAGEAAPKIQGWRDVVKAYTAHQDHIRAIQVEYEHSRMGDAFFSEFMEAPKALAAHQRGTLATDGERVYMEQYRWGDWTTRGEAFPEERPDIHACVWDGETVIEYHGGGGAWYDEPGRVQVHPNAPMSMIRNSAFRDGRSYLLFMRYPDGAMLGYPLATGLRMEQLLQGARRQSLRPEMAMMNDAECYVIDAESMHGTFAVWFDPGHDFNIVHFEIVQKPGHLFAGRQLPKGAINNYTYDAIQFEAVDGLWVPKESRFRELRQLPEGNGNDFMHRHLRTKIALGGVANRNDTYLLHEDYIPNGATWTDSSLSSTVWHGWYDGEIVPMPEGRQQSKPATPGATSPLVRVRDHAPGQ